MCYNPTPLGKPQAGGYCSLRKTPYGEYVSACDDSDFMFGSTEPARQPVAVNKPWFQPLWERDFPLMKQIGVNTIRLYNANPITLTASQNSSLYPEAFGNDHLPFMNMAHEYGFKVTFPLLGTWRVLSVSTDAQIQQMLRNQIDEIGNHPALIMYIFGNELSLEGCPDIVPVVNKWAAYIREYQAFKWGRQIPVTHCIPDFPWTYTNLMNNMDVDIFCTNAGYRGRTFTSLWSGNGNDQPSMFNLACQNQKPVWIGEWGAYGNTGLTANDPKWFNKQYSSLIDSMKYGCIGGAFFEFNDEYKGEGGDMGLVKVSVATVGNQNGSMPNAFIPDIVTPKAVLFQSAINGSYNGVYWNMNTDEFFLAGRAPANIDTVTPLCPAGSPQATFNLGASAATTAAASTLAASTLATATASNAATTVAASTAAASTAAASTLAAATSNAATTAAASTAAASTLAAATSDAATTAAASTLATATASNAATTAAASTAAASTLAAATSDAATTATASTAAAATSNAATTAAASTAAAATSDAATTAASTAAASTLAAATSDAATTVVASTSDAATAATSSPAATSDATTTTGATVSSLSPSSQSPDENSVTTSTLASTTSSSTLTSAACANGVCGSESQDSTSIDEDTSFTTTAGEQSSARLLVMTTVASLLIALLL